MKSGRYLLLEVSDDGQGIEPDQLARVVDPYVSTKGLGRGWGLSVVSGIVERCGGALVIDSLPSTGTTVRILLPMSKAEHTPAPDPQDGGRSERRANGEAILVVDDHAGLRAWAERAVKEEGFRVLLAEHGKQAVDLYRARADDIAVVLLDMSMPVMDGASAFKAIRKFDPEAKVVFCSGYDAGVMQKLSADDPRADFIRKPYTVENLTDKLSSLICLPGDSG